MRVLKFGGTSVGTPESLARVKEIVTARQSAPIVVVSALSGVTDQLIRASRLAAAGDAAFRGELAALRARHHEVCAATVPDSARRTALLADLDGLLDRLDRICEGTLTSGHLPWRPSTDGLQAITRGGTSIMARLLASSWYVIL